MWKYLTNRVFSGGKKITSNVKTIYKAQFCLVDIDDISAESLKEVFKLTKLPELLLDEKANKVIDSKYWKEELKAGCECRIKE